MVRTMRNGERVTVERCGAVGRRIVALVLAPVLLLVGPLPTAGASESGPTPVMARSVLDEDQLVAWWNSRVPKTICNRSQTVDGVWTCLETVPYEFRAGGGSITPRGLIRIYLEEGHRQGLAADVAFMQAILETAWFFYPDSGQVRPHQNNFAGMGAFDGSDGSKVFSFASVRDGVRAQVQHLRIYGDATVNTTGTNLGVPLVVNVDATTTWNYPDRWRWVRNHSGYHASALIWEDFGNGRWASDPNYSKKILDLYRTALIFNGFPPDAASSMTWILRSTTAASSATTRGAFGKPTAVPLLCDWNGDGRSTPGSYDRGWWSFTNDARGAGPMTEFRWGAVTDVPLCGDWNGDGTETIGLWRQRQWLLRNENSRGEAAMIFNYGKPTDTPLVGDWNGDRRATVGVHRGREWILRSAPGGGAADISFLYGRVTDTPLVGDWNRGSRDTVAITR
jgi:hypothetical protein